MAVMCCAGAQLHKLLAGPALDTVPACCFPVCVCLCPVNGLSRVPEGGCSLTLEVAQFLLLTSKSVLKKVRPLFRLISMKTALKNRKARW